MRTCFPEYTEHAQKHGFSEIVTWCRNTLKNERRAFEFMGREISTADIHSYHASLCNTLSRKLLLWRQKCLPEKHEYFNNHNRGHV